jgi:hypothetical protein
MKLTICLPIQRVVGCLCAVALVAAIACADGPKAPTTPSATAPGITATAPEADAPSLSASSPRSGDFHLTKACPTFTGQAGDHCTVIASDLKALEIGTRFVYADAIDANGLLDSDIVLDPPGPGNNQAFGHCIFPAGEIGQCAFSGGTGKFSHFNGSAVVTCRAADAPNCTVEGTYSFTPGD